MSITSEPDNAWIAQRQSTINDDLHKRSLLTDMHGEAGPEDEEQDQKDAGEDDDNAREESRLSGESERIGTGNWDEDVPDGEHVGYL